MFYRAAFVGLAFIVVSATTSFGQLTPVSRDSYLFNEIVVQALTDPDPFVTTFEENFLLFGPYSETGLGVLNQDSVTTTAGASFQAAGDAFSGTEFGTETGVSTLEYIFDTNTAGSIELIGSAELNISGPPGIANNNVQLAGGGINYTYDTASDGNTISLLSAAPAAQYTFDAGSGVTGSSIEFSMASLNVALRFYPGDLNLDRVADVGDIDALCGEILFGSNSPTFDINGDSFVNQDDLSSLLDIIGILPGDATANGTVDGDDFLAWNANKFGAGTWASGDFSCDSIVDGADFLIWNANKFMSADLASVPEPTAALPWSVLLIAVCAIRRIR